MPRVQVYLPDELYREMKSRGLRPSELLQAAIRAELHRLDLLDETDTYLAELTAEVGEPTPEEWARADALVREIQSHARKHDG